MSSIKPTKSPQRTNEILQNASDILDVARNLSPLIPVPVLCSIFVTANGIVDIAIKMRQDKRESAELAEYAATLTSTIHRTIRGRENMIDKDLSLSLNQLSCTLDEIKSFMDRQVALPFWRRLRTRTEAADNLIAYRNRLQYVMQTFVTTSSLRQEMGLKSLKEGLDDLKETLQNRQAFDEQFRIYRWGEIEIIQPLDLLSEGYFSDIEIYEAKIEGQLKVIKVYRDPKMFDYSKKVLKLLRDCPRLPFAQLEGYTNDSTSPFVVLKGGLTNLFVYLRDLELLDYFVERLRFMIDMKRAMRFLASSGFRWKGWVEKLMISESGRLAIGYADDIVQRLDTDSDGGVSRILISWPKLGIAEGLHVLVDRQDDILSSLHTTLTERRIQRGINTLGNLWGRYIDELSCGITSFVSVTNAQPPPVGSVGFIRPTEIGMHFEVLFSLYPGKVNVRTTGQIRPRAGKEDGERTFDPFDARDWRNFEGEEISMPLLLSEEIGLLLSYRTSYTQLHGQSCVVEHLIQTSVASSLCDGHNLESLVIVSGVIERARATFSKAESSTPSRDCSSPESSVYFHPRSPDERGFMRKPWGYLSNTANIVTDKNLMASSATDGLPDPCVLSLSDITAQTVQSYELYCFQFSPAEAETIRNMCLLL